jgi:hypothetical protein
MASARDFANQAARASRQYLRQALAPAAGETGPLRGFLLDLLRSKGELLAENALLRQQLIVAARRVKKPQFRPSERVLLVTVGDVRALAPGLVLVRPETLLRWHRDLFRRLWTWRSKPKSPRQNYSWGGSGTVSLGANSRRMF